MTNFYTDVLTKDARFHTTEAVHDIQLLEPATRAAVQAVIAEAQALGIALIPWETYRSTERQELLFKQGATKLQKVGVHHYGLACDLVKSIGGQPSWKGDFTFLLQLARKHGLISGQDWGQPGKSHSFIDSCHVQRCSLAKQAGLFAGSWYPTANYNPYAG
jgi:hypothetical protein